MKNQKRLCVNGLRRISEGVFGTKSIVRFLSTVPYTDDQNLLTTRSVGELIAESNKQAEKDLPESLQKKYKKFAGKLSIYQHELPHGAR